MDIFGVLNMVCGLALFLFGSCFVRICEFFLQRGDLFCQRLCGCCGGCELLLSGRQCSFCLNQCGLPLGNQVIHKLLSFV